MMVRGANILDITNEIEKLIIDYLGESFFTETYEYRDCCKKVYRTEEGNSIIRLDSEDNVTFIFNKFCS